MINISDLTKTDSLLARYQNDFEAAEAKFLGDTAGNAPLYQAELNVAEHRKRQGTNCQQP